MQEVLATWDDLALIGLLTRRPDLCRPAPVSLAALGMRAASATSLGAAAQRLDGWTLRVAATLAGETPGEPVTTAALAARLGQPAELIAPALDRLAGLGMAWPVDGGWACPADLAPAVGPPPAARTARGPHPPPPPARRRPAVTAGEADRTAGGQALTALDTVEELLLGWAERPPAVLRNGGVGHRAIAALAAGQGMSEPLASALPEWLLSAGLLGIDREPPAAWLPTPAFDEWRAAGTAQRWAVLARTWWRTERVGAAAVRNRSRATPLTGDAVVRGVAPLRHALIRLLAAEPEADWTPEAILGHLDWWTPRLLPAERGHLVEPLLAQAEWLGVCAHGRVSSAGAALLDATAAGAAPVEGSQDPHAAPAGDPVAAAAERMLPAAVDEVLVQADLTIVVPGPPTPALAEWLHLLADLESRGGARVYRLTTASAQRAFDAGHGDAEILDWLTTHSRTPLPQALPYLIRDLARTASPRTATAPPAPRRASPGPPVRVTRVGLPDPAEVVAMLRTAAVPAVGNGAPSGLDRAADPALIALLLEAAIASGTRVWLGYTDAHGSTVERLVRPIGLLSGRLSAHDLERQASLTIPVSRITGVALAEEEHG